MDRPTFLLAESYPRLKKALEAATKARVVAVEAEAKRVVDSAAEIEALALAEREAQNALGAAGKARNTIDVMLPADLRQNIDRIRAELAPHKEALAGAERVLKGQRDHHDTSYAKLDLKTQSGKVDLEDLNRAMDGAKKRVAEEKDRCAKIEVTLARAEAARDAWFAEARRNAFSTKAAPAEAEEPAKAETK